MRLKLIVGDKNQFLTLRNCGYNDTENTRQKEKQRQAERAKGQNKKSRRKIATSCFPILHYCFSKFVHNGELTCLYTSWCFRLLWSSWGNMLIRKNLWLLLTRVSLRITRLLHNLCQAWCTKEYAKGLTGDFFLQIFLLICEAPWEKNTKEALI